MVHFLPLAVLFVLPNFVAITPHLCSIVIFKTSFQLICSDLTSSFLDYANLSNPILGLMIGVVITAFIQENVNRITLKTILKSNF